MLKGFNFEAVSARGCRPLFTRDHEGDRTEKRKRRKEGREAGGSGVKERRKGRRKRKDGLFLAYLDMGMGHVWVV